MVRRVVILVVQGRGREGRVSAQDDGGAVPRRARGAHFIGRQEPRGFLFGLGGRTECRHLDLLHVDDEGLRFLRGVVRAAGGGRSGGGGRGARELVQQGADEGAEVKVPEETRVRVQFVENGYRLKIEIVS